MTLNTTLNLTNLDTLEIYMEKDTQKIEQIEKSYLRGYLNIFTASHHLSGFQKIVNFTKKSSKWFENSFAHPEGSEKRRLFQWRPVEMG